LCNQDKPLVEFYKAKQRNGKWYFLPYCKRCYLDRIAKWKKDNPGKNSAAARRCHIRTKYGMTQQEYDSLVEAQGNLCEICQRPETSITKKTGVVHPLSVDHDHETNAVRGLLCGACNRMLGCAGDDITVLRSAIEYLTRNQVVA